MNTVFRYSRVLITFWAVIVVAALVFYSQTKKSYESRSKILISLGSESLGKAEYISGKNLQLLQREEQIHNEQQILESHEVRLTTAKWILGDSTPGAPQPLLADHGVAEAKRYFTGDVPPPTLLLRMTKGIGQALGSFSSRHAETHSEQVENIAQELADDLTVKAIFDSDALDVSFTYRQPQVAQTVLNLLLAAYLEHHISVFQNSAEADLLKTQLDHSVDQYHSRLGQFSTFMTSHRVYNDDSQANVLVEQREKLKEQLNEALADSDAAEAREASLRSIKKSLQEFEHYSTLEIRNKERDALLTKLDEASVEEQTLLSRHPKGSRAYQEQQAKMDELRHLLDQEPAQVIQETEQRKSKAAEFVESEVISVTEIQRGDQAKITRLRGDLRNIDSEIDSYAQNLKAFNSLKLELTFAKQESEQMAQVYADSRLKNLTSKSAITDVSIIDTPTYQPHSVSPKPQIIAAATILLLLMGGFTVLLACANWDTTVADPGSAEIRLGVPVIGTLPVVREEGLSGYPDLLANDNHREFAKIYQTVRQTGTGGKIILLAESGPKEGSSLVGYSLAKFIGQNAREKTGFIDLTTHAMVSPSASSNEAAGNPAILKWPGGQDISNNGTDNTVSALSQMRNEFAFIVIAAGAVKEATDLLTISGIVSATFFIVESGKTRRESARYSLDLLQRYGFQGIRLILNKRIFYIPNWLMRFV